MSQIFLGYPPPKIKEFIIEHYSPIDMTKVPLTFTAEEAGAKLSLQSNRNAPAITLETSPTGEEGSWTSYEVGTEITLANVGDKVMFRNSSDTIQVMCIMNGNNMFKIDSGKIAASGNIMFLMDKTGELRDLSDKDGCYSSMFDDCTSLTIAPELPATTLASDCYANMFQNCTSLTQAPELPATNLAINCYNCMFFGCTALTQAPSVLPATTLDYYCYSSMFYNCTSLTQAPELLATNLAGDCCNYMFYNCTSLTQAPSVLTATTLAGNCYSYMFQNCTSLTQAPELPATTLAGGCYKSMFDGCTALTQAPALPATTLASDCYTRMFDGCTNIPEPKYNMSHMTFDEVANAIQNNWIFSDGITYEVQCSDKILVATIDLDYWEWTITEK